MTVECAVARAALPEIVDTDIPSRLDRLPWSRFHTLVVLALGITWILDGLEVTLAGAVSGALKISPRLQLTDEQIGASASAYLTGAVLGALFFGWLTDRLGRRRLFFVTLGIYATATLATAFSPNFFWFALFRFLTGAGIGGEYAAINSAIQELIPARFRGRTDLAINGSFWVGAILGSLGSTLLLAPGRLPPDMGWRAAFAIGALLALVVLVFRRALPESPRWLLVHGRVSEAEQVVSGIEREAWKASANSANVASFGVAANRRNSLAVGADAAPLPRLRLHTRRRIGNLGDLAVSLFKHYPRRAVLGLVLMTAQAFFYNAIFFTYALVLGRFFAVPAEKVGIYLLPFAVTNFLGPLALGWLFDRWGRRPMIASTYAASGILLGITALLFVGGHLTAVEPNNRVRDRVLLRFGGGQLSISDSERIFPARSSGAGHRGVLCAWHGARRHCRTVDLRSLDWHWRRNLGRVGLCVRRRTHARRGAR